ncbi:MAG: biotin/lipoyl-binding protein [Caldilineales bacterium]|nr:biotin/lipoyl-binding protein [Caldilineales bacterium]MCW5857532.1 biotin/lipoyl-binding protein [Caldilineales bacterium]
MSILRVTLDGKTYDIRLQADPSDPEHFLAEVDGRTVEVIAPLGDNQNLLEWAIIGNKPYELALDKDLDWIHTWSGRHTLAIRDLEAAFVRMPGGDGRVKAPIPGLIARLLVEAGTPVEIGQPLLVLEAMKMENEIRATRSGIIADLRVQPGQTVMMGEVLAEIA